MFLLKDKYPAGDTKSTKDRSGVYMANENKNNTSPPFTPPADAPFAHPFFWSPFVLIGNWK